jgi:hypothetical protein
MLLEAESGVEISDVMLILVKITSALKNQMISYYEPSILCPRKNSYYEDCRMESRRVNA